MDHDQVKSILSTKSQSELLKLLKYEVNNADKLKEKTDKAELAERNYSSKNESRSWSNSEQYEKSKENIRIIVKYLI